MRKTGIIEGAAPDGKEPRHDHPTLKQYNERLKDDPQAEILFMDLEKKDPFRSDTGQTEALRSGYPGEAKNKPVPVSLTFL